LNHSSDYVAMLACRRLGWDMASYVSCTWLHSQGTWDRLFHGLSLTTGCARIAFSRIVGVFVLWEEFFFRLTGDPPFVDPPQASMRATPLANTYFLYSQTHSNAISLIDQLYPCIVDVDVTIALEGVDDSRRPSLRATSFCIRTLSFRST
jgi:hypothetical protein